MFLKKNKLKIYNQETKADRFSICFYFLSLSKSNKKRTFAIKYLHPLFGFVKTRMEVGKM